MPGTHGSAHSRQHQGVLGEAAGPGVLLIMEHGQHPQNRGQVPPGHEHCGQGGRRIRGWQPPPGPQAGRGWALRVSSGPVRSQTGCSGLQPTQGPGKCGPPPGDWTLALPQTAQGSARGSGRFLANTSTSRRTHGPSKAQGTPVPSQHTHTTSPPDFPEHPHHSAQGRTIDSA